MDSKGPIDLDNNFNVNMELSIKELIFEANEHLSHNKVSGLRLYSKDIHVGYLSSTLSASSFVCKASVEEFGALLTTME